MLGPWSHFFRPAWFCSLGEWYLNLRNDLRDGGPTVFFSLWLINQPRPHTKPSRNKGLKAVLLETNEFSQALIIRQAISWGWTWGPTLWWGGGFGWPVMICLVGPRTWCSGARYLEKLGDLARVMLHIGTHQPIRRRGYRRWVSSWSLYYMEFFFKHVAPCLRRKYMGNWGVEGPTYRGWSPHL